MAQFKRISSKIMASFLAVTVIPLAVMSYISFSMSQQSLEDEITQRLITVADYKANLIENIADELKVEALILSRTSDVQNAMAHFSQSFKKNGPNSTDFKAKGQQYHSQIRRFVEEFKYYDLMLMSPNLDVVFSITHEAGFGTNLLTGPYRDTILASTTQAAIAGFEPTLSHFEYYEPSGEIAAFVAVPMLKEGKLNGVLVVQITKENLYNVITDHAGLGLSGETVVGHNVEGGFLLTAPLRHFPDAAFKKRLLNAHTGKLLNAARGETGHGIFKDYRGIPVLGVWRYLPSYQWGMVVKIDAREAFANINRLKLIDQSIFVATIVVVMLFATLIAGTVSKPIGKLNRAAQILQSGQYHHRINIRGRDEIAQLGVAFNNMALEIADSHEVQERQMAELSKVNVELERFTYTVSHDLKSPLVTIGGFIGMIGQDIQKERYDRIPKDLDRIRSAADKMRQFLDDLLELSRIGRVANPSQDLNLLVVIEDALESVHGHIEARNVSVKINVNPNLPVIYGDKPRITEVWQNLLENAIKFSANQSSPVLEIGARVNGDWVQCYVKDNGMGIDPKYLEKVFGLFERLDAHEDGTGIGLALVKQIVEVHDGRIWAESDGLGTGSSFIFRLPLKKIGSNIKSSAQEI